MAKNNETGLRLSDNSKVKFHNNHKNTFGLAQGLPENGGTCPGATSGPGGCLDVRDGHKRETCYVHKIVSIYKAVGNTLKHNTDLLKDKSYDQLVEILTDMVTRFLEADHKGHPFFRIHWAGDFFSEDYTKAWVTVIKKFSNVRFWAYTRSFNGDHNYAQLLFGLENLTLFLSCDPNNVDEATKIYHEIKDTYPNIGLAWMGEEPPDPEKFRWVRCPETSGKIKSEPNKGACAKCRLCVNNYKTHVKNISFEIH